MSSAESSLWDLIPQAWQKKLIAQQANLEAIDDFLRSEFASGVEINPVRSDIFAALTMSPEAVKVVIVGQDPYPNSELATGRAFAVPDHVATLPGSLRNIFRECEADLGSVPIAKQDLRSWANQGALLLNRCLTTRRGESNSHLTIGWQEFTSALISIAAAANPNLVGVLWGKSSQELTSLFDSQFVIASAHPSPLSAYRGFIGSKPFSKVNDLLAHQGQEPIAW